MLQFKMNPILLVKELAYVRLVLKGNAEPLCLSSTENGKLLLYANNGYMQASSLISDVEIISGGEVYLDSFVIQQINFFSDNVVNFSEENNGVFVIRVGKRVHKAKQMDKSAVVNPYVPNKKELMPIDSEFITKLQIAAAMCGNEDYYKFVNVYPKKNWIIGSKSGFGNIITSELPTDVMFNLEGTIIRTMLSHLSSGDSFMGIGKIIVFESREENVVRTLIVDSPKVTYGSRVYSIFDGLRKGELEFYEHFSKITVSIKEFKRIIAGCKSYLKEEDSADVLLTIDKDKIFISVKLTKSEMTEILPYETLELVHDIRDVILNISEIDSALRKMSGNVTLYLNDGNVLVIECGELRHIQLIKRRAI